jgi:hypothetical protein
MYMLSIPQATVRIIKTTVALVFFLVEADADPDLLVYTHLSDQYAPFYPKVIIANVRNATHVLDGLPYHESQLFSDIGEDPNMSHDDNQLNWL